MRATIRTDHFISDDELHRIGEDNPGWRVERIDGGVVMSPSGMGSGPVMSKVAVALGVWAERNGYVAIGADVGVMLSRGDVLAADGSAISRSRWDAAKATGMLEGYAPIVPDIVVEVASPTDSRRRLREKCARWHDEGATYVVMLDPAVRSVQTWGRAPDDMDIDWNAIAAYDP